jgi:peptide subunit release factor 1 (eRF1)
MTINTYYPPKLFRFLSEMAARHELAVKEVETIFLRKQAESMGFTCKHSHVGYAKKDKKPYCKDCWVRLEQISAATYNQTKMVKPGMFKAIKTFVDSEVQRNGMVFQHNEVPSQ